MVMLRSMLLPMGKLQKNIGQLHEGDGMKIYHIGLLKGSQGQWSNGHRDDTVIVQLRRSVDQLSPNIFAYHGEFITTKRRLNKIKQDLLKAINKQYKTSFKRIVID